MILARWARCLIPRPHLILVLDVPEEQMLERKQEISYEELRRQRAAYACLGQDLPGTVLLDGSCPADDVARHACDVIIAHLRERKHAQLVRPHGPLRGRDLASSVDGSAGNSSTDAEVDARARAHG